MAWNQIVCAVCVVILIVIVYLFITKGVQEVGGVLPPVHFEVLEKIRCALQTNPCLSIYPNPVKENKRVYVTIRARPFHKDQIFCFVEKDDVCSDRTCSVDKNGMCRLNFTAHLNDVGTYMAFIDRDADKRFDIGEICTEEKFLDVRK